MAKSRGLFPGPRSIPKRLFSSSAGNSEYKHNLPNSDGFQDGMTGWKASRMGGGASTDDRFANEPLNQSPELRGFGGLACDPSMEPYIYNKGQAPKRKPSDAAKVNTGNDPTYKPHPT